MPRSVAPARCRAACRYDRPGCVRVGPGVRGIVGEIPVRTRGAAHPQACARAFSRCACCAGGGGGGRGGGG
eukprot:731730-Alexandrium_andersonii.AAC.1